MTCKPRREPFIHRISKNMCFVPPRVGSSSCNRDGRLGGEEEEEGQSRESRALTTNMKIAEREESHRPPLPESTPWLVFPHGEDQTFCSIFSSENKYILKSIPEFHRKSFVASCHGWIVLSGNNDDNHYYLWNPVTLETIKLPPLKLDSPLAFSIRVLSSPPGSNSNCTLLLFHQRQPLISFCRPGDQQWRLHNYEEQLKIILDKIEYDVDVDVDISFMNVVAFNGELHALTSGRPNMVIINVDKPNCLTMRCLTINGFESRHTNAILSTPYLMESCGELLYIDMYYRGLTSEEVSAILVHRVDFDKKVWVEVKSLKDRIIFLGDNCSVSCPANSGVDGSRIYFTMERDRSLYSFNLEDDSLAVSLPYSHLPTSRLSPFWLSPEIRLMTHIGAEGEQKIEIEEHNIRDDKGGDKEYDNNVKELEDERREEAGYLDSINLDILSVVADDLNLFDYSNFRSTCRLFRTAAAPLSRKTALSKLNTQTICPWFMFWKNNNDGVGKFTVPMNSDTFMMNIPELLLGNSICFCSKDGWVLMTKDGLTIFFFNPLTREIGIYYPPLPSDILFYPILGIGFSSAMVTSMDCMMVVVSSHLSRSSSGKMAYGLCVTYIRFGELEWVSQMFEGDNFLELAFIPKTNPVFWNGVFYMVDQRGNLGVLEITREGCLCEVHAQPQLPCESFDSCFLLVCDGELLSVFVGHFGKWVGIYSLNHATLVWVEVESLPNHVLFLSKSSSSSYARTPGEEGNRIYFSRFRDQSMVYYSLETRKYHFAGHEEDPLEDFFGTREHLNCVWFEPKF